MKNKYQIANIEFNYDRYMMPVVCTAIHNGHLLSEIIEANMALSETERLYEEDPYTGYFTDITTNTVIVNYSRFQVDLNRPLAGSFYVTPQQAWGLQVRKGTPKDEEIEFSSECYKWFYKSVKEHIDKLLESFERIFVYDLHSYNHQRGGVGADYDDAEKNPEIIIGTNNMPEVWYPLVNEIVEQMRGEDYFGRGLDVRVNVKFDGGHFSRWLHNTYGERVCCIALEFKKIFMDEWTGEIDWEKAERLREILRNSLGVIKTGLHL
ncbi:MAG: N-formylglutamate amidohydrolase [Candidatus Cloacimonetes bacterium]|nr:N-formylglutamate amidohydrolase [Candidatus Cloacimonadota bacterium]